ncbi:hypothetical protein EMCRGX_G005981 [Ephydatia muelleri]
MRKSFEYTPPHLKMAVEKDPKNRWLFTREELVNSPSRADGVDPDKELSYRQQAANMIHDMGQRLQVNQLCINTAIVYMHRFYMMHSFKAIHRQNIATAALFLAAKVEEQPRKLEYVAKISYSTLNKDVPPLGDATSEQYTKLVEEITYHELLLLQTLGFEVAVEHPHPHVVKCMNLVKTSRDLSQTAYFMAHNSLLLTTFCLEHPPALVACVCIHLACQWKGLEIPRSKDNKNWWDYICPATTLEELNELTRQFLDIYGKCPSRLQRRILEPLKMSSAAPITPGDKDKPSSSGSTSGPQGTKLTNSKHHHHHHTPAKPNITPPPPPPPSIPLSAVSKPNPVPVPDKHINSVTKAPKVATSVPQAPTVTMPTVTPSPRVPNAHTSQPAKQPITPDQPHAKQANKTASHPFSSTPPPPASTGGTNQVKTPKVPPPPMPLKTPEGKQLAPPPPLPSQPAPPTDSAKTAGSGEQLKPGGVAEGGAPPDGTHKTRKLRPEDYHRLKLAEEARLGKRPHGSNSNDLPDKKRTKMESPLSRQPGLPSGGTLYHRVIATPLPFLPVLGGASDKPPLPPPLPPSPLTHSPPPPPPPESR